MIQKIVSTRKNLLLGLLGCLIVACQSNPPAPVVNRLPTAAPSKTVVQKKPLANARQSYKTGDWRPDTYIVKAGDTLFSIGLAFGYDYKEIASANQINAPYVIRVGQTLQLASLKAAEASANPADADVTTYALSDAQDTSIASAPSVVAISEPKALREPYSDSALNTALPPAKAQVAISPETPTAAPSPSVGSDSAKQSEKKASAWAWPTKGKVLSLFNQAGNKGIDIAGTRGQPIYAANSGKVIYSGSDLRGYGKLVIIKHNTSYLSVYAHNSAIMVKEGQQVTMGQKIAEMGDTDSPTVKLHFEIRKQGQSVDPVPYLPNQ